MHQPLQRFQFEARYSDGRAMGRHTLFYNTIDDEEEEEGQIWLDQEAEQLCSGERAEC